MSETYTVVLVTNTEQKELKTFNAFEDSKIWSKKRSKAKKSFYSVIKKCDDRVIETYDL